METQGQKMTWRQKLVHELSEYFVNVVYLTIYFSVFAISRRLILSHFNIVLDDYFIGIIKALVIGKVIMLASFLRMTRKYDDRPLIIPILFKTFFFVLFVALFDALEGFVRGLYHTGTFPGALSELVNEHFTKMWLGGLLMVVLSFLPFFALKELSRVMGQEKFRSLFLVTGKISD